MRSIFFAHRDVVTVTSESKRVKNTFVTSISSVEDDGYGMPAKHACQHGRIMNYCCHC